MGPLTSTLLSLLVLAGLAVLVVVLGRRFGLAGAMGPLTLVGRLPLDARRCLYLVKVGETVLVLGASESGLSKLAELPADAVLKPLKSDP